MGLAAWHGHTPGERSREALLWDVKELARFWDLRREKVLARETRLHAVAGSLIKSCGGSAHAPVPTTPTSSVSVHRAGGSDRGGQAPPERDNDSGRPPQTLCAICSIPCVGLQHLGFWVSVTAYAVPSSVWSELVSQGAEMPEPSRFKPPIALPKIGHVSIFSSAKSPSNPLDWPKKKRK